MDAERERVEIILDQCVEDIQNGKRSLDEVLRAYPSLSDELKPLLEVVIKLQGGSTLSPSKDFSAVADIRLKNLILSKSRKPINPSFEETIYQRIKRALFGSRTRNNTLSGVKRFSTIALIAVIAFTFLLVSSGVVIASAKSLPGNIFYPVKLSLEKTQLSLSGSSAEEGLLHLEFASRRLEEAEKLLSRERPSKIEEVIDLYARQVSMSLEILLEEQNLTEVERRDLAQKYEILLSSNELKLNDLLNTVPIELQDLVLFALTYSRNGLISMHDLLDQEEPVIEGLPESDLIKEIPLDTPERTEVLDVVTSTALATPQPFKTENPRLQPPFFDETAIDRWSMDPVFDSFFNDLYWPEAWFVGSEFEWPEGWPTPYSWSDLKSTVEPTLEYLGTALPIGPTQSPIIIIPTVFPPHPPTRP